jgi:hypothetical protein
VGYLLLIKILSKEDLIKRAFEPLSNAPNKVILGGINYAFLLYLKKGYRGYKGLKYRSNNSNYNYSVFKIGG